MTVLQAVKTACSYQELRTGVSRCGTKGQRGACRRSRCTCETGRAERCSDGEGNGERVQVGLIETAENVVVTAGADSQIHVSNRHWHIKLLARCWSRGWAGELNTASQSTATSFTHCMCSLMEP